MQNSTDYSLLQWSWLKLILALSDIKQLSTSSWCAFVIIFILSCNFYILFSSSPWLCPFQLKCSACFCRKTPLYCLLALDSCTFHMEVLFIIILNCPRFNWCCLVVCDEFVSSDWQWWIQFFRSYLIPLPPLLLNKPSHSKSVWLTSNVLKLSTFRLSLCSAEWYQSLEMRTQKCWW